MNIENVRNRVYTSAKREARTEELRTGVASSVTDDLYMFDLWDGTPVYDRFNAKKNLKFDRFDKNPILLVDHRKSTDGVVGRVLNRSWESNELFVDFELASDAFSQSIGTKWDEGFIKSMSISFYPEAGQLEYIREKDDKSPTGERAVVKAGKSQLLEISLVALPADEDAIKRDFASRYERKFAIDYTNLNERIDSLFREL